MGTSIGRKRASGFTMIELLIVVAVVAVVATLGAPAFGEFVRNMRLASGMSDLNSDLLLARGEASASDPLAMTWDDTTSVKVDVLGTAKQVQSVFTARINL
jgi:prepilin-type N-terminal cleavage/methylation domain-containing protein